jgi:hypothetical protein
MSLRSVSTIGALVSFAFVAAGLVAGCVVTNETTNQPSGGGQQAPVYPYPTESDFCLAKAKAECNGTVVNLCNTTVDACVKGRSASAICNPASLPYDPAPAQACITALTSAWADGVLNYTEIDANTKACTPVFTQKHVSGDVCAPPAAPAAGLPSSATVGWETGADAACDTASGLSCVIPAGKAEGTCVDAKVLPGGGDCSIAGTVCDQHLYCKDGTCAVAKNLGEACTDQKLCDAQYVCTNGLCANRGAKGTKCTADADCAGQDGPTGFCIKDAAGNGQCFDTFNLNPFANSCASFK